jgi:hypothetical protein
MTPPPPETSDERRYPLAKYFVENHPEIEPSDAWAKEAVDLYRERNALKVENERLKQSAVEVAKLNQPNLEQIMALSVEVESLKAKLAAPSKP